MSYGYGRFDNVMNSYSAIDIMLFNNMLSNANVFGTFTSKGKSKVPTCN